MSASASGFKEVFSPSNPCPVCGRTNRKCKRTQLGKIMCRRTDDAGYESVNGYTFEKLCKAPTWAMWIPDDPSELTPRVSTGADLGPKLDPLQARREQQWEKLQDWLAGDGEGVKSIAGLNGPEQTLRAMFPRISPSTFNQLSPVFVPSDGNDDYKNWLSRAIGFPEVNGDGDVIGYSFRWADKRKKAAGSRGLTVPARLAQSDPAFPAPTARYDIETVTDRHAWTIYIVEGASDVLAMSEMGLLAIGRPSNVGGAVELAEWIKNHLPRWRWDIVVLGENDRKDDGTFPGLDGAKRVSQQVANDLGIVVRWAMPPAGSKDVRDWFETQLRRKGQPSPATLARELESRLAQMAHPVIPGRPLPEMTRPDNAQTSAKPSYEAAVALVINVASLQALAAEIDRTRAEDGDAGRLEGMAAQNIAAARADQCEDHGMRCSHPRPIILHDLVTDGVRVQYVRCENYIHCDGCRCWRIFREVTNATLRFHGHNGPLYEMQVAAERWDAVRRRISRMGGDYMRVHEDCEGSLYYVVTSAAHPDAVLVRPDVAVSTVQALLDDYHEQRRPVATSHRWKLPQPDKESHRYERVGMGSRWLNRRLLREIAKACEAEIKVTVSGTASRLTSAYDLMRIEWDEATRHYCYACLMAGETFPRDLFNAASAWDVKSADPVDCVPW